MIQVGNLTRKMGADTCTQKICTIPYFKYFKYTDNLDVQNPCKNETYLYYIGYSWKPRKCTVHKRDIL